MLPPICQRISWIARVRALPIAASFLVVTACDNDRPITGPALDDEPVVPGTAPSLALAYSGGIPFGLFAAPTAELGSDYNVTVINARNWLPIWLPERTLPEELAAIKARGSKVILGLAGGHAHYLDENGHFSMAKWKERVNAFKVIPFSSYITDGTVVGHLVIDEPNDASNWGGIPIPPATVEEMARYSKQLWPAMATLVRVESTYLAQWSGTYRYLDAAWAQYVSRKGDPKEFITRNVADAKRKGLALITGLNILKGHFAEAMSPTLIKSAGSALLSSWYPCAFVNWKYDADYLATSGVTDALKYLRSKALSRDYKSCRS
ncbi:MAG TPA: hypothetical protein VE399_05280 [Gemmatimonadales bacterium]|nr:hypothetical protein [Gemmatimonadales bacterium]